MLKIKKSILVLTLLLFGGLTSTAWASGVVTFQVEVIPGFTISSPETLVFQPVAPGQTDEQDLSIIVWSNVQWGLSVRLISNNTDGIRSNIKFRDHTGKWEPLEEQERTILENRAITGPEGREVTIPFRFRSDYHDLPGTYSFGVEFTVVPAL